MIEISSLPIRALKLTTALCLAPLQECHQNVNFIIYYSSSKMFVLYQQWPKTLCSAQVLNEFILGY